MSEHHAPQQFDPVVILSERFARAIREAFPEAGDADPMITPSRRAEFGDFQSNAAMPLAKKLGVNPREAAAKIIAGLDLGDLAEPVSEQDIAGPGFINLRLKAETLGSMLGAMDTPALGVAPPESPPTVVVDLCGVNLAKQMHVGHLRSMVIGDAVARSLERLGAKVVRQNHVGDWGLPIAMVTARVRREAEAGRLELDQLTLDDLDRLYREAQLECSPDGRGLAAARKWDMGPKALAELEAQVSGSEEALAYAKETLLALQSGDAETVRVWRTIADVTLNECLAICKRLRVLVTEEHSAGESSYAEELMPLVQDLIGRHVAEEDNGALIIRVRDVTQPCLVRKSDGGFLYATTDLAAIRRRVQKLGADRVIYCVDARQSLHFQQVFGAAIRAGYATKPGAHSHSSLEHAGFGMVLGEDHRPFKTRSGENVKLAALLEEAHQRALSVVTEKNPDLPEADRGPIASDVAVAAIKYADLSNDRVKDYVFSFDRMLSFEGNTGPYLLYALVRVRSIFRKAATRGIVAEAQAALLLREPAERTLALTLLRYPSVVRAVGETLEPHRLCNYLYELASSFSGFFDACPVLNAEDPAVRASRLRLCALTGRVLEDGLTTLGMPTPERM